MFIYNQLTGAISHDNGLIGVGYSGHGEGKNSPVRQAIKMVGPIPCGKWKITELIEHTDTHGPFVMRLKPEPNTETFGRSGFLIHGDSIARPGEASEGCIIMSRPIREAIWHSGDRDLEVVSGLDAVTTIV